MRIYETLLKVVRNTNNMGNDPKKHLEYRKPANHKEARIKRIEAMDIGEDAVTRWKACNKRLFTPLAEPGATRVAAEPRPAVSPLGCPWGTAGLAPAGLARRDCEQFPVRGSLR